MEEKKETIYEKMAKYKEKKRNEEKKDEIKNNESKKIVELDIDNLYPFKDQPFNSYNEEEMKNLKESIERIGLQNSIIVRNIGDEKYEILAGHNRVQAYKELGINKIESRIVDVDEDIAQMIMIDTNIVQRDKLSPMERARAYKIKKEIKERKGFEECKTDDILTDDEKKDLERVESERTFNRYLSLNNLIPEYQAKCENGFLSATAGEHLSKLNKDQQQIIYNALGDSNISESRAKKLKELIVESSDITEKTIRDFFFINKDNIKSTIKFTTKEMEKYFGNCKTTSEIKDKVIDLLEKYM